LSEERTAEIRQHLATCPYCPQELTQLQAYLSELASDLDYTFQERVKIWIARLMPPAPSLTPTFALRGESDGPLMYEAGNYQLTLEVQDDPANPGYRTILGLVLAGEEALQKVELWQNGRSIQETILDELGNFVFSGVQPGSYDLILSQRAAEIHVQAFTV
ncbi:MAG: hypothetical protein WAM60_07425, partial [Candidatus Promineifilaceae bacterium]